METLSTPLSTMLAVTYESTNITKDVAEDLISVSYTDNIADEADEVAITLKDEKAKWAKHWTPTRGDTVQVIFLTENRGSLTTGKMIIDKLSVSGRPRVFSFSAVSIPLDGTIRRTIKTRAFEGNTLKGIAQTIADENGLTLFWDSEEDPTYDRIDQKQESDLVFLKGLCDDAGLTVKVTNSLLVLFDQKSYESKTPIMTIEESGGQVLSWSFDAQQSERYKSVTVKWRNVKKKTRSGTASSAPTDDRQAILDKYEQGYIPAKGSKPKRGSTATREEYIDYTYDDPDVDDSGQVYVLKKRCTSLSEAERLAKAKLRSLNLRQLTGSLTLIGNPVLCAGSVVELSDFGSFDGDFIIERAVHTMNSSSGYQTQIDVRRVNSNY